jgi:hypothetical protein
MEPKYPYAVRVYPVEGLKGGDSHGEKTVYIPTYLRYYRMSHENLANADAVKVKKSGGRTRRIQTFGTF